MHQITPRLFNWASILDENTEEQARTPRRCRSCSRTSHSCRTPTSASGRPSARSSRPSGASCRPPRRRHRLRHDRRPNAVHRRRPRTCRALARCASRSSARSRFGRARPTSRIVATRASRGSPSSRHAAAGAVRPGALPATGGSQLGTLGSGNHFIEVSLDEHATGSGRSCTRVRAASATSSPTNTSPSHGADGPLLHRPGGPRPRLPRPGHARVHRLHPGAPLGAALRPAHPRGDDGPGPQHLGALPGRRRQVPSGSTATTTSPSRRRTGASPLDLPEGGHRGRHGDAASSPAPWAPGPTSSKASATPCRAQLRTARCRSWALNSECGAEAVDHDELRKLHPEGHRVPGHRGVPGRDPGCLTRTSTR